ncbi:MAG: DoxX family protein [Gemmatimonadota bacterium]
MRCTYTINRSIHRNGSRSSSCAVAARQQSLQFGNPAPMKGGIGMSNEAAVSKWTIPALRIAMGIFLALWGVDKIIAAEGAEQIFQHFYLLNVGAGVVAFGILEIALGALLAAGFFRVSAAWIALGVNAISTVASWKQILDPWGKLGLSQGGTHLFLASIVIIAVNIVLVLNARGNSSGAHQTVA